MAIELKVPEVGESITEVEIGGWLKAAGQSVQKDEPVVTLESEKATVELPAPESGTLLELLKQKGKTDVLLVAGGIIPDQDIPQLTAMGFTGVFGPGTNTYDLVKFVQQEMARRRATADSG